jgi:MFS family permease
VSSPPPTATAVRSARRRVIAVASATFFAAGVSLASLGPALPELARNPDARAGGVGLVLGMGSAPMTIAASVLVGLSFGPIYPTTIALVAIGFPTGTGTVAGVVMTLGSLGGAVLPWLYGILILQVTPLAGVDLVPLSATAMLGLWATARHLGWRPVARPVTV